MELRGVSQICVAVVAAMALLVTSGAEAVMTKQYKWDVDYVYWSPDCVEKVIIGINGNYPGPTIRANAGDTIQVNLTNFLVTEGVTMHWHGIRQKGTPWADGTAAISQCAINSGETFVYEFLVDKPGTYFYHGHFGCQRATGFYGSLIVDLPVGEKEPFDYDDEFSIIVNDWWHRSVYDQEVGLLSLPFRWVGEPQSLLMEGRGKFNCSEIPTPKYDGGLVCNQTDAKCAPHVISVIPGVTYRLRLASVASLSSLNFKIEGHNMTVVEADGNNVEPFVTDNLDLYSGETYSVLFTADQPANRNYWLALNVRGREPIYTPTGLGILNYKPNSQFNMPDTPAPIGPAWNDYAASVALARMYKARTNYTIPVATPVTRTLNLLTLQTVFNDRFKWSINNVTYVPLQTPLLASLVYKIPDGYDTIPPPDNFTGPHDIYSVPNSSATEEGSGVYMFQTGDVVDIIIQNANTLTPNKSEIHPWHLHGHDFWVLAYGYGMYNPVKDSSSFNLVNPPLKNTVAVFPYSWTALRFVADNPGAWAFHCHVEWHFHLGMGVMFAHGIDLIPSVPKQTMGCGLSKTVYNTP